MRSPNCEALLSIGLLILSAGCSSNGGVADDGTDGDAGNPSSPDPIAADAGTPLATSDAGPAADRGPAPVCNLACYGSWICDPLPGSTGQPTRYTAEPAGSGGCNLLFGTTVFWWLTCDGVAQNLAPSVCGSPDGCGPISSSWEGSGDSLVITQSAGAVSASQTCRREGSGPAADAGVGVTCWDLGAGASSCGLGVGTDAGTLPADWCDDASSKIVCSDGNAYEWRCGGKGGTCSCQCNWSGVTKSECTYPAAVCGKAPPTLCLAGRSACNFPAVTTLSPPHCSIDTDCPSALPVCRDGYCGEVR
jgi:hypothetical protein